MSCSYWNGPCMCRDECAKFGCRDARPVAARAHGEIMTDEKQGRATPPSDALHFKVRGVALCDCDYCASRS